LRQRAQFRESLGETLEHEHRAAADKHVVGGMLADDFGRGAPGPCAVGVAPDFTRRVGRFDRADQHDPARRALIHRLQSSPSSAADYRPARQRNADAVYSYGSTSATARPNPPMSLFTLSAAAER
jgi:hypothetical protein